MPEWVFYVIIVVLAIWSFIAFYWDLLKDKFR